MQVGAVTAQVEGESAQWLAVALEALYPDRHGRHLEDILPLGGVQLQGLQPVQVQMTDVQAGSLPRRCRRQPFTPQPVSLERGAPATILRRQLHGHRPQLTAAPLQLLHPQVRNRQLQRQRRLRGAAGGGLRIEVTVVKTAPLLHIHLLQLPAEPKFSSCKGVRLPAEGDAGGLQSAVRRLRPGQGQAGGHAAFKCDREFRTLPGYRHIQLQLALAGGGLGPGVGQIEADTRQ